MYTIHDNISNEIFRVKNYYEAMTEVERRIGMYKKMFKINAEVIENNYQLLIVNKREMKTYDKDN